MPLDPGGAWGGGEPEDEFDPRQIGEGGPWTPPFTGGWVPSTPEGEGGWVEPEYDPLWGEVMGGQSQPIPAGPGVGGGGGGGGGGPAAPELPPWAGQIPRAEWYGMTGALPWQDWGNTPWTNVPEGRGAEAQTWLNTVMPWYSQQQAWNQFNQQLAWQQRRFGSEQDWAREQFNRQLDWERAQQAWQARQNAARRALERELANVQAFGRRWRPQTRWL